MKKLLTFFMAFVLIICSVFVAPFSALAEENTQAEEKSKLIDVNPNGMYDVTSEIYADAYMLINLDDDTYPVIAAKNANEKKYPASLTKIVTAMVTINNVPDISAKTTVSDNAVNSLIGTGAQIAGLHAGDEITIEELLYLTMVHSACDACEVLAEYVGGSVTGFVEMMNKWVKSLGCNDTNFVNADGLHDDNHYTTAHDMAVITLNAMKNDTFNKISSTKSYKYKNTTFIHTNYMLDKGHLSYYYEYADGIKTGSTTQAGYCVITKAAKNGYNYLAVVMDSPIKKIGNYDTKCSFVDAGSLFDWAFDSLKYSTIIRKNDVVSEVPIKNGKDADTLQLVAEKDITTLVPSSLDPSAVLIKPIDEPTELEAPISQGDKVCEADIIYGSQVIATINLVAAQTVELSTFLKIFNIVKTVVTNKFVLAAILLIIILVIAYGVAFVKRAQKNKRRIAEKRRRQNELDQQISDRDYLPPPKRRR